MATERLMGEDEAQTVKTITAYREVMSELIKQHRGRVIDSPGDNLLAEFASVVDAVQCAVAVQKEFHARNAELPENRRMVFRIGINLGDVIQEGDRIYGDGVNIAARLESLADPGGICVSKTAFDHIETKLPLGYEYLGDQTVKNIAKPVGAYRLLMEPRVTVAGEKEKAKLVPFWRRKSILAGGIALALVVIAALIWNFYFRPPPMEVASKERMAFPLPEKPSIAVLPFVNMSDDPKQEHFSDGITEDLITDLSKISGIFVIARASTFTYKGKPVKIRQVAEELGVRYVLEGSVRRAGEQVRINAQLIDSTTGHHMWAERYDGHIGDVFALQDNITRKIVTALAVKLTANEEGYVILKDTKNVEAYDAFLKGWEHYLRETPDDFAMAISYFKKAIELDPNYGRAYAALAMTYWKGTDLGLMWWWKMGLSFTVARFRARDYLEMAMKNPTSIAHQVASLMALHRRQHEEAIAVAERAIALDPNDPGCHRTMASALIFGGRAEEAVGILKKVMLLDPRNLAAPLYLLGVAYFAMGQLEEAATFIDRALRHNPERRRMAGFLAAVYAHLGRDQEARAALDNFALGFTTMRPLRTVMNQWPFKDPEVAERLAEGLIKAGLPGQSSEYYKVYKEYKLTGEEIRDLVLGRTVTGIGLRYRQQWWVDRTQDGKATFRNPVGSENGTSWIERDMLCNQWETFYGGLRYCFPVFRNPEGTPEMKNEYLSIADDGIGSFSPVD